MIVLNYFQHIKIRFALFFKSRCQLINLSYVCPNPLMWRWRVVLALAPETGFFYGNFFAPYPNIIPLYLKNLSLSKICIISSLKVFLVSSRCITLMKNHPLTGWAIRSAIWCFCFSTPYFSLIPANNFLV